MNRLGLRGYGHLESDLGIGSHGTLGEHVPHPTYDALFPQYVELCAVTQLRTVEGRAGGVPGHAVMYLQGACWDADAPYPRLQLVDEEEVRQPEAGVGVSVNRYFRNANWIAVPGRKLFFDGTLTPGERVTEEHNQETLERALSLGLYDGLKLHDYPTDAPRPSLRDFVLRHSLGSDFALTFARSVLSIRVPVTQPMMRELVTFLNDLNHQYATGSAEYDWSGYEDNCVHALHNALAAAGIWKPKAVRTIRLRQFFNLALPANAFLLLALRTMEFAIEEFRAVWNDVCAHDSLLEFDWLPGRHGALISRRPVRQANDLYDTGFHLFVLERPFRSGKIRRAETLLGDPRFLDLEANLRWFRERYCGILDARLPDQGALLRGDRYRAVRRAYYAYVEHQLADVEAKLSALQNQPKTG